MDARRSFTGQSGQCVGIQDQDDTSVAQVGRPGNAIHAHQGIVERADNDFALTDDAIDRHACR